jgi:hypothetical protein
MNAPTEKERNPHKESARGCVPVQGRTLVKQIGIGCSRSHPRGVFTLPRVRRAPSQDTRLGRWGKTGAAAPSPNRERRAASDRRCAVLRIAP